VSAREVGGSKARTTGATHGMPRYTTRVRKTSSFPPDPCPKSEPHPGDRRAPGRGGAAARAIREERNREVVVTRDPSGRCRPVRLSIVGLIPFGGAPLGAAGNACPYKRAPRSVECPSAQLGGGVDRPHSEARAKGVAGDALGAPEA
jgi:hypothetical protein